MKQLPSSTEDIFVREMIVHGNKGRAIREAFPRMLPECIPAAIQYMMENPEVVQRIDAGIIYFYRELLMHPEIAELPPLCVEERVALLRKIILRTRRQPRYIRTDEGLRMIMVPPTADEVSDAVRMLAQLKTFAHEERMVMLHDGNLQRVA